MLACSGAAHAQLVDGGFDLNPLTTMTAVIGGTSFLYGVWGQESATLSTGLGPNMPASPTFMLSSTNGNNSGVTTQTAQAIDVSVGPWAPMIATGTATFSYSALFNADTGGPIGGLSMGFYNSNTFGSLTGSVSNTIAVDNVAGNWEILTITGAIPVGTQSLLAQVYYVNSSLATVGFLQPGFADSARLTITALPVPEPGTWATMGLGVLLLGWRCRGLAKQQGN